MIRAGVMGWPVAHSLSPRLHGWWLKHYGIDGSYEVLPVQPDNLGKALHELSAYNFSGVNLTMPHKEAAIKYLDIINPTAKRIGAVNTVILHKGSKLEGRNTDVYGFAQNLLSAGYRPDGKPAVLLGAGGAARAAVAALLDMGIHDIRIVNRTKLHARAIADSFGAPIKIFGWDTYASAFDKAGLLVNATSLGMHGQPPLEVDLAALPADALVSDMINVPLETGLLKAARERGNPVADGLGMLLHQARPAFAAFFGIDPEVTEELRRHVLEPVRG